MKCNGKCYLAKQLKKAEQQNQDKSSPIPNLKLKSVDWIAIEPIVVVPEAVAIAVSGQPNNWPEQEKSLSAFSSSVFHPPTL